jgi:hypothetical protein
MRDGIEQRGGRRLAHHGGYWPRSCDRAIRQDQGDCQRNEDRGAKAP